MRRTALLALLVPAALVAPLGPTAAATAAPVPLPEERPVVAAAAPARAAAAPPLRVDLTAGRHTISPLIYGLNFADASFAKTVRLPVDRWGGNSAETYNWRLRGSNHGQDWYFENFPDCWSERFGYCSSGRDFSAVDAQVTQDRKTATASLLALPMMGWVAGSLAYGNPHPCAYPSSAFDPQDDHDPFNSACGNGRRGGQWINGADPNTAGTPAGPAFSADWIASLVQRYGAANAGGVGFYELGNEPALWDETHHPFHPQPTTYDELWAKSRDLATAVKGADPGAKTLGPSEWGWPHYFCSAADHVESGCSASSPDRAAHGGTELSAWYLQRFRDQSAAAGRRLLDYFDLHYYSQGSYSPATDTTRSLYDATYTDPSWIGQKIMLLPRMKAWVQDNYPGTKLALSEYNLGSGADERTQNVIEADTLGLFGRYGVGLATFWPLNDSSVPKAAFRLFRNYDGQGSGFGERGVTATSGNPRRVSVYAARVGVTGALTVLVVNKDSAPVSAEVALAHAPGASSAEVFQYAGSAIRKLASVPVTGSALRATLPAASVTVFEVALPTGRS